MSWFGSLGLAYKYSLIFGSLLLLTILAGFIKVLYDRRRLKRAAKEQSDPEAGGKDDQLELNQREKDEGDLFGIRAIEAGFFAGVAQSRPTSRAGSIAESPSTSTSTLVGGSVLNSPKIQTHSMSSSVTTLPLAHANGCSRDSETLPADTPPRRKSPPTLRLAPSEAELSGRINHNAAVNMNLNVPPSPVTRSPTSPKFSGSDSDDISPRSPSFPHEHYAPVPPQIPMPESLRVSVHSAEETSTSQAASFNDPSPGHSAPSSPAYPPETRLPTMPARVLGDEPRSSSPAPSEPRPSLPAKSETRVAGREQLQIDLELPLSPILLHPRTYQPTHHRYESDASSVYSNANRMRAHQHECADSADSYNFSFPEHSSRNSLATDAPKEHGRRPSASSSMLAPGSSTSNQTTDSRLSDFYDAYYRHSQVGITSKAEVARRPNQMNLTQPTIVEVPSPMPSPHPQTSSAQPGVAL